MKRLRLAVIGVGHLGKEHARILSGLPDVELTAVVDTDLDQAQAVARRCGTQAYADVTPLLDRLDDRRPEVRIAAVRALGAIECTDAIPALSAAFLASHKRRECFLAGWSRRSPPAHSPKQPKLARQPGRPGP